MKNKKLKVKNFEPNNYSTEKLNLFGVISCFFGFHKWENIDDYTPEATENGLTCYQNLHRCTRCKNEQYKGMGCI